MPARQAPGPGAPGGMSAFTRALDPAGRVTVPSVRSRSPSSHSASPGNGCLQPRAGLHLDVEVLQLIGRGWSDSEIAGELFLSETAVKTHVTRIFTILRLGDRAQAVVLAYETGLVTPHR